MNKRIRSAVLSLLLMAVLPGTGIARDRLADGYSNASGVFAGLWVAQEGKILLERAY